MSCIQSKKFFSFTKRVIAVLIVVVFLFSMNGCSKSNVENSGSFDSVKSVDVGEIIKLGSYEQDNDKSNGKEKIEWVVLAEENGKALVISKYALDCKKYNETDGNVTWETCTLRKWLNNEFLIEAFSPDEQSVIMRTVITADANPSCDTSPGNDTSDKVFLLSTTEAKEYFSSDEARMCAPTAYAKEQGAYTSGYKTACAEAACLWWLRSPGFDSFNAAYIFYVGTVIYSGEYVNNGLFSVRPALWITL